MCIVTRIEQKLAKKAALDAEIARLEKIQSQKSPLLVMLQEILNDIEQEAPEELPNVWQEILIIGQHYESLQSVVASELEKWQLVQAESIKNLQRQLQDTQTENEKLKQQLEEAQLEITEQDRGWGKLSDERDDSEVENQKLKAEIEELLSKHFSERTARLALEKTLSEVRLQFNEYRWTVEGKPSPILHDDNMENYLNPTPEAEEEAQVTGFLQIGDAFSTAPPEIPDTIPALTLWQPWASLVGNGKNIETRSWSTSYRGPLAIHAAKRPADWSTLNEDEYVIEGKDWPLGAVVAIADLVDCIEMTPEFIAAQTPEERQLGMWQPGRFAWVLENVRPLNPPVPTKGGQKLWQWDSMASAAELEKLKVAAEPEESQEKDALDTIKSIFEAKGFFQSDNADYETDELYETYRGWDIFYSIPNGGIVAIGLYNSEYDQVWDASTEYIQEIEDAEFPESLADYDDIVKWTRAVIDQVENLQVPGQLALPLEFPAASGEQVEEKLTELQKLLKDNNDFTFEELGVSVTIESVIAPGDDTVDFESEETLIKVSNFSEKREYYVAATTFVYQYPDMASGALAYAQCFLQDLKKDAAIKEKIAKWNAEKSEAVQEPPAQPKFEVAEVIPFKVGDRYQWNDPEDTEDKSRSQGLIGIVTRITKLGNIAWTPEGLTTERLLHPPLAQRVLVSVPIAETDTQAATQPETETRFEAMGYSVQVYPQYADGKTLAGATFRFLNSEGVFVFDSPQTKTEIGDRQWKAVAEDLIQNWQDKEAARIERQKNPHKKPEDDFIELIKLNPSVGYLKQKVGANAGKIIAAYVAFANKDSNGNRTATNAKPRAKQWRDFYHSSFQGSRWEIGEVRNVQRMKGEPGKPGPSYEFKIVGASMGQVEKLAEQDFSLLPNEVGQAPTVIPVAAAAPTHTVMVNSCWLASGSEEEMKARFDEELHLLGGACTSVALLEGEKIVEKFALNDFEFVRLPTFTPSLPEYEVTHIPTEKKFTVWRKTKVGEPGETWHNCEKPGDDNWLYREGAAANAVRRSLAAERVQK